MEKKSQNIRNQGFSYYFSLMVEDPDPKPDPYLGLVDPDPDSEDLKTYRYGSDGS